MPPTLSSGEYSPDPRAWCAATLDAPDRWYYRLSSAAATAITEAARRGLAAGGEVTQLTAPPELREALGAELAPVRHALEHGRGFAIQEGWDTDRLSRDEARAGYWLLGQCLGRPVVQNVQGTLLYDVRDTGQSVEYGARFSVTNADSSYHTDNSFGEEVTDYVGLLCLRTARSGGVNHLVSGWTVRDELSRESPELLEVLRQPFHVDRRGGFRAGEEPTARMPVIGSQDDEPLYRYLRYWIEVGHQKAEVSLTPAQLGALDRLDEMLRRPDLRGEFSLQTGQILWLNNRWLLHSRTAFEDHAEPDRKRHLVRLWLKEGGHPRV